MSERRPNDKLVERAEDSISHELTCCAMADYGNSEQLKSTEEARAIRYAAYEADDDRAGYVIATLTQGHLPQRRYLYNAGFKRLARVKNPRTGNTVTIFGAPTLGKLPHHKPNNQGCCAYGDCTKEDNKYDGTCNCYICKGR